MSKLADVKTQSSHGTFYFQCMFCTTLLHVFYIVLYICCWLWFSNKLSLYLVYRLVYLHSSLS